MNAVCVERTETARLANRLTHVEAQLADKDEELERVRKDAERYRWLRFLLEVRDEIALNGSIRPAIATRIGRSFFDVPCLYKERDNDLSAKLDLAIDAFMQPNQESTE